MDIASLVRAGKATLTTSLTRPPSRLRGCELTLTFTSDRRLRRRREPGTTDSQRPRIQSRASCRRANPRPPRLTEPGSCPRTWPLRPRCEAVRRAIRVRRWTGARTDERCLDQLADDVDHHAAQHHDGRCGTGLWSLAGCIGRLPCQCGRLSGTAIAAPLQCDSGPGVLSYFGHGIGGGRWWDAIAAYVAFTGVFEQ